MFKTKKFIIFLSVFILTSSFRGSINSRIDDAKIDELVTDYISKIESASNTKSIRWYASIDNVFSNPNVSTHTYDISDKKDKVLASAYFLDASKTEKETFMVEILKEEIKQYDDCIHFDESANQRFVFVELPKIIIKRRGKQKVAQLLKIDVTSNNYKIDEVLNLTKDIKHKYLTVCEIDKEAIKKQEEIRKKAEVLYQKVIEDYGNKNYAKALLTVDGILKLNHNHSKAKDALDALKKLITVEKIENHLLLLLKDSDYDNSKKFIKIAFNNAVISEKNYKKYTDQISNEITKKKQEFNFSKAEYFYEDNMHQKALLIYQELLKQGYTNPLLNSRIVKCKEADPKYVQNQLNIADKMGLKSKKNWLNTFKTYYKYEYSGLLRADQYFFMMIMMLDKKHSRVGKPMGFSRGQMETLAKKYFYEAKNRGYNVSYEENHIFTQSITKFKNNGK